MTLWEDIVRRGGTQIGGTIPNLPSGGTSSGGGTGGGGTGGGTSGGGGGGGGSSTTKPSPITTTTTTTQTRQPTQTELRQVTSIQQTVSGKVGTYNPYTYTYTSPTGEQSSRAYSQVPKGTVIELKRPTTTPTGKLAAYSKELGGTVTTEGQYYPYNPTVISIEKGKAAYSKPYIPEGFTETTATTYGISTPKGTMAQTFFTRKEPSEQTYLARGVSTTIPTTTKVKTPMELIIPRAVENFLLKIPFRKRKEVPNVSIVLPYQKRGTGTFTTSTGQYNVPSAMPISPFAPKTKTVETTYGGLFVGGAGFAAGILQYEIPGWGEVLIAKQGYSGAKKIIQGDISGGVLELGTALTFGVIKGIRGYKTIQLAKLKNEARNVGFVSVVSYEGEQAKIVSIAKDFTKKKPTATTITVAKSKDLTDTLAISAEKSQTFTKGKGGSIDVVESVGAGATGSLGKIEVATKGSPFLVTSESTTGQVSQSLTKNLKLTNIRKGIRISFEGAKPIKAASKMIWRYTGQPIMKVVGKVGTRIGQDVSIAGKGIYRGITFVGRPIYRVGEQVGIRVKEDITIAKRGVTSGIQFLGTSAGKVGTRIGQDVSIAGKGIYRGITFVGRPIYRVGEQVGTRIGKDIRLGKRTFVGIVNRNFKGGTQWGTIGKYSSNDLYILRMKKALNRPSIPIGTEPSPVMGYDIIKANYLATYRAAKSEVVTKALDVGKRISTSVKKGYGIVSKPIATFGKEFGGIVVSDIQSIGKGIKTVGMGVRFVGGKTVKGVQFVGRPIVKGTRFAAGKIISETTYVSRPVIRVGKEFGGIVVSDIEAVGRGIRNVRVGVGKGVVFVSRPVIKAGKVVGTGIYRGTAFVARPIVRVGSYVAKPFVKATKWAFSTPFIRIERIPIAKTTTLNEPFVLSPRSIGAITKSGENEAFYIGDLDADIQKVMKELPVMAINKGNVRGRIYIMTGKEGTEAATKIYPSMTPSELQALKLEKVANRQQAIELAAKTGQKSVIETTKKIQQVIGETKTLQMGLESASIPFATTMVSRSEFAGTGQYELMYGMKVGSMSMRNIDIQPAIQSNIQIDNQMIIQDKIFADKSFVDKIFTDKTFMDKTFTDKTFTDKSFADKTFADKSFVDKVFIDKTFIDKKFADKTFARIDFARQTFARGRAREKLSRLMVFFPRFQGGASKSSLYTKVIQAYDVILFNRGKEQVIGKGLPIGRAKALGVKSVISNLRASFALKPSGTTTFEDIPYRLPETFRLGKYNKLRFVQKLTTRFGTRGETKEAQFFRKVKKGKVRWF